MSQLLWKFLPATQQIRHNTKSFTSNLQLNDYVDFSLFEEGTSDEGELVEDNLSGILYQYVLP